MLRLIIKLLMTIPAIAVFVIHIAMGFLLWDRRLFIDASRMMVVVWSDNEPPTDCDLLLD